MKDLRDLEESRQYPHERGIERTRTLAPAEDEHDRFRFGEMVLRPRSGRISREDLLPHGITGERRFPCRKKFLGGRIRDRDPRGELGEKSVRAAGDRIGVLDDERDTEHPRRHADRHRYGPALREDGIRHEPEEVPQRLKEPERDLEEVGEVEDGEIPPPFPGEDILRRNALAGDEYVLERTLVADIEKLDGILRCLFERA